MSALGNTPFKGGTRTGGKTSIANDIGGTSSDKREIIDLYEAVNSEHTCQVFSLHIPWKKKRIILGIMQYVLPEKVF